MSFTEKWNLEKPIEGALDWNISLNSNFDKIDSALQDIRTNFSSSTKATGPDIHSEVGSLWYSMLENPGEGLFIKKSTGFAQLLDKLFADGRYMMKDGDTFKGSLYFGSNATVNWFDVTTQDFTELIFQTYSSRQSLVVRFGTSTGSAIRFVGNDGVDKDVLHVYVNKITAFKPVEVPNATSNAHAINKGQADLLYATQSALQAALDRITALEQIINAP